MEPATGAGYRPAAHETGFRDVDGAPLDFDAALERQIARQTAEQPPGRVAVHRWYLRRAPAPAPPAAWPEDSLLVPCEQPPTAFYRFLYQAVGEPWSWSDWLGAGEERLAEKLGKPGVSVTTLFVAGAPMGFFELRRETGVETVEIVYFGLAPWAIGRGFGPNLLRAAVASAGGAARPVIVNTCTLDHPKALRTYQSVGFEIIGQVEFFEPDPRIAGDVRIDASAHMPLAKPAAPGL